ncbi:MAG: transposase [Pyrinomonadaceae bacterium]
MSRAVPGRLRQRGPRPVLTDAEVLSVELVGEYLGLGADAELFAYFRRAYPHFFPALRSVHRTTFARQAANLWRVKEVLWQRLLPEAGCDPTPERSRLLTRIRYRIETVFSQLCERFSFKRVRARDLWHLSSRLLRKALAHTLLVVLNRQQGHEPLRLAELLTN